MKKIDPTVRRETAYIAFFVLILSIITECVFIVIEKWSFGVLFGNILSSAAAIVNFLLMGITLQTAVHSGENEARKKIQLSQTLRTAILFFTAAAGCILPCFNTAAVLIPLFFPRIAIAVRPLRLRNAR